MDVKRKNYSENEKQILMSLVGKYKSIIENKSTKQLYVDKKKETWELITSTYNSSADSGPRTAKQLKILYENLKREIRKNVAAEHQEKYIEKIHAVKAAKSAAADFKKDIFKTGGGPSSCSISNEQELLLVELQEQVQPLENFFDSAAEYMMQDIPIIMEENQVPNQTPTQIEPVLTPQPEPVHEPRKKIKKTHKKNKLSAEQYRRLYFRQKYFNALKEGKEQAIIRNLSIKKLKLEIKKLEQ